MATTAKVTSMQGHLWGQVHKCLDEIDRICGRMDGYCNELDEMADKEERENMPRPKLRLVASNLKPT